MASPCLAHTLSLTNKVVMSFWLIVIGYGLD